MIVKNTASAIVFMRCIIGSFGLVVSIFIKTKKTFCYFFSLVYHIYDELLQMHFKQRLCPSLIHNNNAHVTMTCATKV
jgi:nicotinamide riboside transporter PnuC